jgi:hypothetical protein
MSTRRHDGVDPQHFLLAQLGDRDAQHLGLLDQQPHGQPFGDIGHAESLRHRSPGADPIEPRLLLESRDIYVSLLRPRDVDDRDGRRLEHARTASASASATATTATATAPSSSTPAPSGSASTSAAGRTSTASPAGRASTATAATRVDGAGAGLSSAGPRRTRAPGRAPVAEGQALQARADRPGHLDVKAEGPGALAAPEAGSPARRERSRERRAGPRPTSPDVTARPNGRAYLSRLTKLATRGA